MKYMMFVCTDTEPDPPTGDPKLDDVEGLGRASRCERSPRDGRRPAPGRDATTVRMRGGKVLVTDGPFAETREWIAGFDILEYRSRRSDRDRRAASDGQVRTPRAASVPDGSAWRSDGVMFGEARRIRSIAPSPRRWPGSGCASSLR